MIDPLRPQSTLFWVEDYEEVLASFQVESHRSFALAASSGRRVFDCTPFGFGRYCTYPSFRE